MPGVVLNRRGQRMLAGIKRVVRSVTKDTKDVARKQLAARLTPRAGYLITHKEYEDGLVGYVHSRWWRAGGGGKTVRVGSKNANDILAIHATGGTITPVRGRYLYIPLKKGTRYKSTEWKRQAGISGAARSGVRLEYVKLPGDRVLVVEKRGKGTGRGTPIALLVRKVVIPKRLDIPEIKRRALRNLVVETGNMLAVQT